jgi:polyhydroxyalkanoate synthase subunit PhaC
MPASPSARLGRMTATEDVPTDPLDRAPQALDRALNASLARFTQGIAPASLIGAYMDWAVHLAMAPGKRWALALKARRKLAKLASRGVLPFATPGLPCIEPLPQDKRFAAPEWRQWPFDLIYQGFLLEQQWWHNATTGVDGVSAHHEDMVNFFSRQWLDMFSPSNFVATNPEVLAETLRSGGMNLVRGARSRVEDALKTAGCGVVEPSFRPGRDVALTPGKVVFRNHLVELIQYAPQTSRVFADPVLIVPSWIMKYYILDLSRANSLVRHLVDQGHTVFMLSWRNPGTEDRDLGMDDYLHSGVMAAIDAVSRILPKRRIQATGYCLGGTLLAIAAAAMARDADDRLASLTLLASELDFTEPGELGLFIDEGQLAYLDDLMSETGYLDGKQMAGAFALINSRDLVWSRMEHEYLMGRRRPLTDLAAWNADATRMPMRQHHEYLHGLYLRNDLAEGRYRVGGRPVALSDIRVPVFVVATERDTVSPWRSVYKVHLLAGTAITFCLCSGGHNAGIVNPPGIDDARRGYRLGEHAKDERYVDPDAWLARSASHAGSWWPAWTHWLSTRAGRRVAPPVMGEPGVEAGSLDDAPGRYVLMA